VVYQVFKAAKSINETILLEMPVPTIIKDALPKVRLVSISSKVILKLVETYSWWKLKIAPIQV
jgi:hypothetical protein